LCCALNESVVFVPAFGITIGKLVVFIGLMLVAGVRFFRESFYAWNGRVRLN
jgi:hypothetical protein